MWCKIKTENCNYSGYFVSSFCQQCIIGQWTRWWNGSSAMWSCHSMWMHFARWISMEVPCQGVTSSWLYFPFFLFSNWTDLWTLHITVCDKVSWFTDYCGDIFMYLIQLFKVIKLAVFVNLFYFDMGYFSLPLMNKGLVKRSHYNLCCVCVCVCVSPAFFLRNECTSGLFQACCKEHHSDTLYSEDFGSKPCAKVAAQIVGHRTLWSTTEYVTLFFASRVWLLETRLPQQTVYYMNLLRSNVLLWKISFITNMTNILPNLVYCSHFHSLFVPVKCCGQSHQVYAMLDL